MSVHGDALTERIRSAMASNDPDEIVSGVKQAVALEVGALSPDVEIVFTSYFNHTYMPDLVVEWQDAGKRDQRPIFLRTSLRASVAEADVAALSDREPVVLSLAGPAAPDPRMDGLRERARQANRVLVTDVASLAEVAAPSDADGDEIVQHGAAAPLLRLVQTNLLKGGRGLFTAEDARRLTSTMSPSEDGVVLSDEFMASFESSTEELFAPDAAHRLRRSAELLRFGLDPELVETLTLTEGQLSDVELRVLLPYLLSDPTASSNVRLWNYIGSMMSLERLENMWDVLPDIDVSALVVPNVGAWQARRAQLVINSSYEDHEGDREVLGDPDATGEPRATGEVVEVVDSAPALPSWFVRNRMLTAEVGPWRLWVTTDARRLKGRKDSTAARWDDLVPLLQSFALDAVDLRGVSRRIFVGAEQSGDVSGDVARIRETIEDSFQVTEVRVRRIGDDDDAGMRVDFTEMGVTAEGRASVAALVSASLLLAHRRPPDYAPLLDAGSRRGPN